MLTTPRIREIVAWILLILVSLFAFSKRHDDAKLIEEKARAEEKILFYEQQSKKLDRKIDSLFKIEQTLKDSIVYHKNHQKVIEKKYVEIRNNVLSLSTDDKIRYLSTRLSSKAHN